jgi:hypothetical protein
MRIVLSSYKNYFVLELYNRINCKHPLAYDIFQKKVKNN